MNQNINLNLLKYFYEVVNAGNITKASEKLLVSQPAITKAIKELETELNITLLERSKKGVVPTNEGRILYEHIESIFQEMNTTLNVLETSKTHELNLYIGSTTTNFLGFIMDALNDFKEKNPDVHIHIVLEDPKVLDDMRRLGKLDILIKNDYENMSDFKKIQSFSITDQFVVSKKAYPEFIDKTFSLEELLKYPFVLLNSITHGRKNFNEFLKSKNIYFTPTYEFNSYSLCRELIRNGFGIGIGNPIHYLDDDFTIIQTDFSLPTRTFDIGYISTSSNPMIHDFIDILKNKKRK